MTNKTVKCAVERAEAAEVARKRQRAVITMTRFAELVAKRVAKSTGRISAKRSLPMGRVAGHAGSARSRGTPSGRT